MDEKEWRHGTTVTKKYLQSKEKKLCSCIRAPVAHHPSCDWSVFSFHCNEIRSDAVNVKYCLNDGSTLDAGRTYPINGKYNKWFKTLQSKPLS
jgi:hypothetical protein